MKMDMKVIYFDNDVISTSSSEFCTYHENHFYFTNVNSFNSPHTATGTLYMYNDGWYKEQTSGSINKSGSETEFINLNPYGTDMYYVLNQNGDGFVECTNNHNPSSALDLPHVDLPD